jgi:carbon monoxide dehydrogenase subunit G
LQGGAVLASAAMINTRAEIDIAKPPSEVFAFIDDMQKTPEWNLRCVEVKQTSPGPRAVGAKLHYVYKEGSRRGEMDGEVTAYEAPRELGMRYVDRMLAVNVGFTIEPAGTGTHLVHTSDIEPRSLFMKLMSPLIRGATRRQTDGIVRRLKELLEA